MGEMLPSDVPSEIEDDADAEQHLEIAEQASQPFIGRWNKLISTTNWEKGRIICEWRAALIEGGAPTAEYSDEAWSQKVGNVTGQHVGRLRRVYQRFGDEHPQYESLFWSHFQAALDWNDAEMWLEGAVQNSWSVSGMRRTRWETLEGGEGDPPRDEDIVAAEIDEDAATANLDGGEELVVHGLSDEVRDPDGGGSATSSASDGSERGASERSGGSTDDDGAAIYADEEEDPAASFVRPFENLEELPDDLNDAFESFKLAILRHKADKWQSVRREDVLASLDALKELTLTEPVN